MVERNTVHPTTIKKSRCTDQNLFSKKFSCKKSPEVYTVLANLYLAAKNFSGRNKSYQEFLNYLIKKNSYFKII